uniref:Uncharacterized protein n=1 Tax=uncultured Planctomycetales bacterium HF0200_11L05 TaxID=723607 RepID=E7C3T0_9BACT|nr:hypothetical protein [uncultured Planctomycetales bacterium HF0200_11L05]
MKRFLLLLIFLNSYLAVSQDIPEKLFLSSKALLENQSLYPVYRIDLIIFSHKQINEKDKQEQFPELDRFIYSADLLKLLDTPNLLVKKEAIEEGLVPSSQVIQSIDLSQKQNPIEPEELEGINNEESSNDALLPYEYFELIEGNDLNKRFISRLNKRKEYEVVFSGSWFQPLFQEELSSPVYIQGENKVNGVYGELLLYKERFLHSELRLRLSESTREVQEVRAVKLYNFNNLLKLSKAQNRFISFFKSIGEEFISFSSWILSTKEFNPVSTTEETPLNIKSNYRDLYEINQQIKMTENSYHYIDHPFFGAVIKVTLWPSR